MKVLITLLISIFTMTVGAQSTDLYDYSFIDIDGNEVELSDFKGKKIMFINVASKCGFTPQYEDLQKLHEQYGDQLVLIGFPSNQFMKQEPGSEAEIKEFCQRNYGVDFLMASKIDVKGSEQHPIYTWLTSEELNGVESTKVGWNFQKYLVDEEGKYLQMFKPGTNPLDEEITKKL
ncbi:MAG: glutathione peroxidase [Crocinitomicaceae bacterium]|nr:glutathione peroxidase [Crocinitomicaceae bacterium]